MTLNTRKAIGTIATIITAALAFLVFADGVYGQKAQNEIVPALENVRAYTPAVASDSPAYAIDGGLLYAGEPGNWQLLPTPDDLIVNAVAVDPRRPETVVIGAADRSQIYVSRDRGFTWSGVTLESSTPSGVTALAIDGANRVIYVGTFTNGLYRLRDVGSSVIASGHLLLDEPVLQVVADSSGTGMAFVRTEWNLYRAEELGLQWMAVDDLPSPATALAIAGAPTTVYVGTASSGILRSLNGVVWERANDGLNYTPGSQLYISALATDPLQPNLLYAATNLVFGSANARITPVNLAISTNSAATWQPLDDGLTAVVTDLMPRSGQTGVVYGLTEMSRQPVALGDAPQPAIATQPVAVVQPALEPLTVDAATQPVVAVADNGLERLKTIAWVVAGLATTGLLFLLGIDIYGQIRHRRKEEERLARRYARGNRMTQAGGLSRS